LPPSPYGGEASLPLPINPAPPVPNSELLPPSPAVPPVPYLEPPDVIFPPPLLPLPKFTILAASLISFNVVFVPLDQPPPPPATIIGFKKSSATNVPPPPPPAEPNTCGHAFGNNLPLLDCSVPLCPTNILIIFPLCNVIFVCITLPRPNIKLLPLS
jgi:hypothetical protein